MGEIIHKLTHAEEARARLLSQYAGLLERDLDPVSAQVQEVEDAFWQVLTGRSVLAATGHTLDILGRIVGEDREGQLDPIYRIRIRARIAANVSDGTWDDIHRVMAIILDSQWPPPALIAQDFYPAGFTYRVDGIALTTDQKEILKRFLRQIRGAAIGAGLGWTGGPLTDAFTFALGSTLAAVAPIGSTALQLQSTAGFPATGTIRLGFGATVETLAYTGVAGNFLTGVTATANLQGIDYPVSLIDPIAAPGKGYSSTLNPALGGAYASIIEV